MRTPNSRSCHSSVWGDGFRSVKFSARQMTTVAINPANTAARTVILTFGETIGVLLRRKMGGKTKSNLQRAQTAAVSPGCSRFGKRGLHSLGGAHSSTINLRFSTAPSYYEKSLSELRSACPEPGFL